MWGMIHLECGTGIRTHTLSDKSLLLYPLDQVSRPNRYALSK